MKEDRGKRREMGLVEEVDVDLSEFMLEDDEREVRRKIGRYTVFEINDEFRKIVGEIALSGKVDEETKQLKFNIDNAEMMVKILRAVTDLPRSIYNTKSMRKILKRPKKIFFDLINEIQIMITEVLADGLNMTLANEKMFRNVPGEKKGLLDEWRKKEIERAKKELEEEKEVEKSPEEIELEEVMARVEELKKKINKDEE